MVSYYYYHYYVVVMILPIRRARDSRNTVFVVVTDITPYTTATYNTLIFRLWKRFRGRFARTQNKTYTLP